MSIQSEIERISGNVQDTISAIQQTGVTVPEGANSDNLPSLAAALANEKQDKLTGTSGQFVGFNSGGNATAVAAPTAAQVGAVPTSRTVNGKALSANISLTAADVGADAAGAASGVQANLTAHINNKSNPHGVTKAQVGLGNVDNTSDLSKPISTATQTALNGKQATVTGGASTITGSNLTANRALVSNGSGKVAVSAVTSTELGYLDGVTSNIQTQINNLGVRVQQTAQLDIYKNGDIYEAYANSTLTITISPYATSTDNFFGDGAYSGLNELGLTGIAASYLNSTQSTTLIGMAYAGEVDGQTDKLVLLQSELSTSVQRIRAVVAANSYSDYKVSIEPGTLVAKWIKT